VKKNEVLGFFLICRFLAEGTLHRRMKVGDSLEYLDQRVITEFGTVLVQKIGLWGEVFQHKLVVESKYFHM
jgi:hypothetical protein